MKSNGSVLTACIAQVYFFLEDSMSYGNALMSANVMFSSQDWMKTLCIVSILNSLWEDNFLLKVQFYVLNFVKVFSSFMHSIFHNVKNIFLNKFLKPLMLKVSLGSKIVKNTFNERLILVKVKEKICRSAWVK